MALEKSFTFEKGTNTGSYLKFNEIRYEKSKGTMQIWFDFWKDRTTALLGTVDPEARIAIMCDDNYESFPNVPFDINSMVNVETEAYNAFKSIHADTNYSVFPVYPETSPQQVKVACWNVVAEKTDKPYDILKGTWEDVIES